MNILSKLKNKYELTRSVKITDVKGYLQKEFDRAKEREDYITTLENKVEELTKTELKYDALLVIQKNTQERIENQNNKIKELKVKVEDYQNQIKIEKTKQFDIKVNSERLLNERDLEIKTLKKEILKLNKLLGKAPEKKTTKKKG